MFKSKYEFIERARQERRDWERRQRSDRIPPVALLGASLVVMLFYLILVVGHAAGF